MDEYARRLCTCMRPTSFFRSLSLSSHLLALSISLLFSHLIPYGGVPRMCVQAKAHHGGVGYQTRSRLPSAGFSFFLSSLCSSPFIFLPSFSSCLSLPILYNCPIFLFFFSSTSPRALPLSFSFSLLLSSQRGSHLGECVASSNAPSRITINYLLRYLSPSISSRPVLHPAIYSLGPMCRVTLREEMKDFHCEQHTESLFRSFLHSAVFLRPLSAILSVPLHLAMSQSERVCI